MLACRTATEHDLAFIIGLIVQDSVVSTNDDPADAQAPEYRAALAAITADPNQDMFIAEYEGVPVGCFQLSYLPGLMRRGGWRGQIEVVHISADRRSLGLGSQMIRWAIDHCRERGCAMVQLTSSKKRTDAHRFYERLGFTRSHEGFKLYL